ncbi:MAG: glucosamine-6-phosphate isomerase [Clostridia bacterium]|nr:glucosamine-6-phosphate isomerase [Clostridia bacterium]
MTDYYRIPAGELGKGAKIPLKTLGDSGEVFYELALEMVSEIERNNVSDRRTVFIVPVGPVGQYPIFVRLVNEKKLSLKNVWFFNMDEYMTSPDALIDRGEPLSFRGFMDREVYGKIDPALVMPEAQRVFPDPHDPEKGDRLLEELGGADICFGGIGINGHLAFNEADPALSPEAFAAQGTRVLRISRETLTANAIGDLGGAIEAMPPYAVTIGIRQILAARKVRLGVFRDWHRAVVRRAAYGEVSSAFPVTLLQNHPDALILVNANAARQAI